MHRHYYAAKERDRSEVLAKYLLFGIVVLISTILLLWGKCFTKAVTNANDFAHDQKKIAAQIKADPGRYNKWPDLPNVAAQHAEPITRKDTNR